MDSGINTAEFERFMEWLHKHSHFLYMTYGKYIQPAVGVQAITVKKDNLDGSVRDALLKLIGEYYRSTQS